ncbi:hypothetical protein SAY86_020097 [Trapa natans]|uniref:Uncharacterized protein n=1 Tax=Trapa natans TaxID=22666 RepID=A0AAN7R7E0_TRANT|nr:hypothetical protein SAY86_020097 [Trapa natans]
MGEGGAASGIGYETAIVLACCNVHIVMGHRNVANAKEAEERDVIVNLVHPGPIATNIFSQCSLITAIIYSFGRYFLKGIQQGVATTCYVAWQYFADCSIAEPSSQAKGGEMAKKHGGL